LNQKEGNNIINNIRGYMKVKFVVEIPGLGSQIKALRKASSETNTQLAADAGISTTFWQCIEKENKTIPIEYIRRIEEVLKTSLISTTVCPICLSDSTSENEIEE
jgi:transcriptional regulator with XRE-family HTH domain